MAGTDARLAPTRLLDGSWRWHDGPRIVVGAPEPEHEHAIEELLFTDAPGREDWHRVRTPMGADA